MSHGDPASHPRRAPVVAPQRRREEPREERQVGLGEPELTEHAQQDVVRDAGVIVLDVRLHDIHGTPRECRPRQLHLRVDEQDRLIDPAVFPSLVVGSEADVQAPQQVLVGRTPTDDRAGLADLLRLYVFQHVLVGLLPEIGLLGGHQSEQLFRLAEHPALVLQDHGGGLDLRELPEPRTRDVRQALVADQLFDDRGPTPAEDLQQAGGGQVFLEVEPPLVPSPEGPRRHRLAGPVPGVQLGDEDRQRVLELLAEQVVGREPTRLATEVGCPVDVGADPLEYRGQFSLVDACPQLLPAFLLQSRRKLLQRRPEALEERAEDLLVAIRRRFGRGLDQQSAPGLPALLLHASVRRCPPRPFFQQRAEEVDELGPGPPRFQLVSQPIEPQLQDVRRDRARLGLLEQDLEVHDLRMQRLAGEGQPPQAVIQPSQSLRGLARRGGLLAQLLIGLAEQDALAIQLPQLHLRDELGRGLAHQTSSMSLALRIRRASPGQTPSRAEYGCSVYLRPAEGVLQGAPRSGCGDLIPTRSVSQGNAVALSPTRRVSSRVCSKSNSAPEGGGIVWREASAPSTNYLLGSDAPAFLQQMDKKRRRGRSVSIPRRPREISGL